MELTTKYVTSDIVNAVNFGLFGRMTLEKNYLFALGNKIRQIREKKEISQVDLSIAMNTDQAHISRVENGHRDIHITWLVRLSKVLEVTPEELLPKNY